MRIVIKIGTSTLTYPTGLLNLRHVDKLIRVIADLKNEGHEIVIVSSGAIALGAGKLGIRRPKDLPGRQACAAVGQCELMYVYDKLFGQYNHTVSQVLMTYEDVDQPVRRQNAVNTLETLIRMGVIPIVNENDTVSTEEVSIGDNDTLSAIVGRLVKADLLFLLSDIDGLYDQPPKDHPQAHLIPVVHAITPQIEQMAGGSGSDRGTGGMVTKLSAAKIALESGFAMSLINGDRPESMYQVLKGDPVGTLFIQEGKDLR
jgi:glutamate 5-kinase